MSCNNGNRIAVCLFLSLFLIAPALAYSAEATSLYNSGNDLTNSGNYTAAIASYTGAVALEPAYFEAWNGIADTLNRNGQFDDALAASNRSLAIHPEYVNGWINRGLILYNIGYQYEDVRHDMIMANEYYAEQLDAFNTATGIDPDNAEAWFNKGYALAGMHRFDEALAAFDRVQAIDPSYPNLAANRKNLIQLRDASTPVYVKYAVPLGIIAIAVIGAIAWFVVGRKKED
jgi:tetratricopeptide (TPR) repeat protein